MSLQGKMDFIGTVGTPIVSRLFRSMMIVTVTLIVTFTISGRSALAQDPPQLQIDFIVWDIFTGPQPQMVIHGENFDNGYTPPRITINGYETSAVLPISSTELTVDQQLGLLHAKLFPEIPGDFIVEVVTGQYSWNYDAYCFHMDEFFEMSDCELGTGFDHHYRRGLWRVPQDPFGNETAIFSWKDGPTSINDIFNKWGDPVYYQLLEDYSIDLRNYLNDYDGAFETLFYRCRNALDGLNEVFDENPLVEWYPYLMLEDGVLTARRGYRWDGPSIQFDSGQRLAAKPASLLRATLVHDVFYDFFRENIMGRDDLHERKLADCLWFMLARQDHYELSKTKSNYTTIREFGWGRADDASASWKRHATANPRVVDAAQDNDRDYYTVDCALNTGSDVTLDAGESVRMLKWVWTDEVGNEIGAGELPDVPEVSVPLTPREEPYTFTLTVDDGDDDDDVTVPDDGPFRDSDEVRIKVIADTQAPQLSMVPHQLTIWPPDHAYSAFAVKDHVAWLSDDCATLSPDDVVVTRVTSDESEDASGRGDGKTLDDIVISPDGKSVDLRRELQKFGNGRVYTVHVEVGDDNGNAIQASFQVHVPTNYTATAAIDDGPVYTVLP